MPQLYRVFVSHAAKDRWIAERMVEALRARGARPFLDVYDIEKGDNIPEAIRMELNRADELVALFTSSPQRAWVWAEIAVVWGRGKRIEAVMHNVTLQDLDATTGRGPLGDSNTVDLNDFDTTYSRSGEGSGRGGGRGLSAMTNVFVSYSRDDKELADKIRRALAEAGVATSTGDDTIPPGARWRETLVKKLDKADAVVAVVSKSTVESSWRMTELGIAWGANKKIIGVLTLDEPPDELRISPLKDVKLLRAAKTDMAQLAAEILK